ncbi:hypothetical protein GCM10009760_55530 [Kitasatospora kazusensis]|uniref:Uncharacterized protein n=1 Tax=Kitasatospora kazusensis TaxID=407974 RepID=A0ABN3A7L0_9ACTN
MSAQTEHASNEPLFVQPATTEAALRAAVNRLHAPPGPCSTTSSGPRGKRRSRPAASCRRTPPLHRRAEWLCIERHPASTNSKIAQEPPDTATVKHNSPVEHGTSGIPKAPTYARGPYQQWYLQDQRGDGEGTDDSPCVRILKAAGRPV